MKKDLLEKANKLNSRIKRLEELLGQLKQENPNTGEYRYHPITLTCGMSSPVDFNIIFENTDAITKLDSAVYKQIITTLEGYLQQLNTIFEELGENKQ